MNFESVLADKRFELGEGPFYDVASRTLYWVDIIACEARSLNCSSGAMRAWSFNQPISAVVPRQNGGLLVALANGLAFLDPETGRHTPFVAPEGPDSGNRSNEARVDPQGRFWLGTMQNNIGPAGEGLPITRSQGALYRVTADGAVTRMEKDIGISNTLCWDEARGRLYFADTQAGTIFVYDWDGATGEIANRRVFAGPHERGFPDGSALDVEGYLWNARWGGSCLIRYAPDGRVDRIIDVPVQQPTSCVFGGEDLKTLYVTSARAGLGDQANKLDGALLRADADVAGQSCTAFAG